MFTILSKKQPICINAFFNKFYKNSVLNYINNLNGKLPSDFSYT